MNKKNNFLPFAKPSIDQNEINAVIDVMRSGWITTANKSLIFEKSFSEYENSDYAISVNSATAGLHLALEAIGIKSGDKVVTSTYTFTATAEAIRYLGAEVVFVDIDDKTFNLDANQLESKFKECPDIKAIVPVHFAGQCCDMDPILELAEKYNCKVVNDAAHALPSSYKGKRLIELGDISVFSFYATKSITTGEGGMIITNNLDYKDRISIMRSHGINNIAFDRYTSDKPAWHYDVVEAGFKYNLTDIASAIGIEQLKKCDALHRKRELIAKNYNSEFRGLPLDTPFISPNTTKHSWHLYVISLHLEQLSINRNEFIELMSKKGVGTSVHFIPLHIQPYWRDLYGFVENDFPKSIESFERNVSLPIYPDMTKDEIKFVVESVKDILNKYKN
tara:strand:- start:1462 stop:2637 length:1176 start_codon:yes stop_codon:yes gene_type:complete